MRGDVRHDEGRGVFDLGQAFVDLALECLAIISPNSVLHLFYHAYAQVGNSFLILFIFKDPKAVLRLTPSQTVSTSE